MLKKYRRLLFTKSRKMSADIDQIGVVARNSCIGCGFLMRRARCFSQPIHSVTVELTSADMCGETKVKSRRRLIRV